MPAGWLTRALLGLCIVTLGACADAEDDPAVSELASASPFTISAGPSRQWKLPALLREVSGLAMSADGRLFGIEDELAYVYELDYEQGALVKRFSLGGPPLQGDFEGVAIAADGDFYMVTSAGRLYRFQEGGPDEAVRYQSWDIGTREICELEGLAWVGTRDALALACKRVYDGKKRHAQIYFWSPEREALLDAPLEADIRKARPVMGAKRLHVSGIEWDAQTNHLIMVSAREKTVVAITQTGELLWAEALPPRLHRQAEGITFDPTRRLLIADEGSKGAARLTIYPRRPDA